MRLNIWYLGIILMFSACRIDGNENVEEKDLDFSTTDDSEIFFKNVRQLYYDLEEIPAANLNVYRIKERSKEVDYSVVNLAIVWNWLEDEAYILIEPNRPLEDEDMLVINWEQPQNGEKGIIQYEPGNNKSQLIFATDLYNRMVSGCKFEISVGGETKPFLAIRKDKEAFRKTMADYYRLTRTYE